MYGDAMFWFFTTIQAIVFDANIFCYRISQLTQLTSPECFDQMKYVEQQEESLQQIVSTPREEFQTQIISGIYYHNAILQNLSEQDTCFGSKDLIDRERKAVDLYDQRDSKGQMSFSSFNQLPTKLPANSVAPSNEVWNIGDRIFAPILVRQHALTAIQQLQRHAIVFRNVLASNQHSVVKEATYNPLICYENSLWTKKLPAIFGGVVGRSSRLPYAQQGLGSNLQHQMVAAKSIQSGPLRPALKGAPMDILYHSEIGTPAYYDRSHESYQSAVETNRKTRIFWLSR